MEAVYGVRCAAAVRVRYLPQDHARSVLCRATAASSMGEHAWFEFRDAHARTDPRSSVDRAPPSEGGGHWFKSSRGYCCLLWRLRGLGTPSGADDAVDSFTEEIGMPVVARVLVDQVQHHQPERHILAPASLVAEHIQ
ncbi:MAG: hypothetical protein QOE61_6924 [Micromonosporaceae bacterium]|nr:hypothetical protein [Micromonosporaceae bacterium]